MIVSKAEVILQANGGQKIKDVCDPKNFHLNSSEESTQVYLKDMLAKYLSEDDIENDAVETLLDICTATRD